MQGSSPCPTILLTIYCFSSSFRKTQRFTGFFACPDGK
nr:MAG TPA: hypothetical protein [Caudoviricetes sp.]